MFCVAAEREAGGWEILDSVSGLAPQEARDSMGSVFRRHATEAKEAGDLAAHAECMAAAERMDWEAIDEQTVLEVRYRVIRVRFLELFHEEEARLRARGANGPAAPSPKPNP